MGVKVHAEKRRVTETKGEKSIKRREELKGVTKIRKRTEF